MTTTCGVRAVLVATLLPLIGLGQSLEERAFQARKMQSPIMSPEDQAFADSVMYENRGRPRQNARDRMPLSGTGASDSPYSMDSLYSGPADWNALDSFPADSAYRGDSLQGRLRKYPRHKSPPKRFEQRIFQNGDRSVFTSGVNAAGRDYILGPGDEITIYLWGDKEKEYSLAINQEGKIFLEGIGVVALSGKNLDGAMQLLKQRLSKVYSGIGRGSTHLDVSLARTGPIRVFALGEVKAPGSYVFSGHTSVLSAMFFAKGPTDIGTVRNLQLTRSGVKHSLDLYGYLLRGEALSPNSLQDGDILFAGRAEALVGIEGDIGRPAVYEMRKGEGIKELLEFAGGLNPTAASHKLTMQRIFENGQADYVDLASPREYLSGAAKMELRDGDRVLVEKSVELGRNYLAVAGPVKYPGTYEATGITTVQQLVAKAGGLKDEAYLGRVHVLRLHPDGSSSLLAFSLESGPLDTIGLLPKDNVILYSLKEMKIPDSVQIAGAVFNPGAYEFRDGMTVKDLVMQAGGYLPYHKSGNLLVFRGSGRELRVEQIGLTVKDGLDKTEPGFRLEPNDLVQVPVDPSWYQKEIVVLDGLVRQPGKYALLYPGEKLSALVERAGGFKENAYIEGGRFFRSKDSVGRVGVDISQAIHHPRGKSNIPLVAGDSIYIPERLNTVKVIGEVGFETSILFKNGASVQYYIEKAGGYTRRSEKDRIVVQYANGETSRDGYFNRKPDAGSVIYVPQGPEPKPTDWMAGLNTMLQTAGIALALVVSIQALSKN